MPRKPLTEEQKERRRQYDKHKRANMTPEQRARRNEYSRRYKQTHQAQITAKQKEKRLQAKLLKAIQHQQMQPLSEANNKLATELQQQQYDTVLIQRTTDDAFIAELLKDIQLKEAIMMQHNSTAINYEELIHNPTWLELHQDDSA